MDLSALRIGITCYPTVGGSGIIATEVGLALAARGHQVHFIASAMPMRLGPAPNVWFHEVGALDYPLYDRSPYTLALTSKMVEVCRAESLDLLHVHYAIPHATSAYLARQILGARAPRVVTTLHGTDSTLVGRDPSFLPITRFSILQSDGITVPSSYLQRATHENLDIPAEVPIEVIPNFVDAEHFVPARPRPDVAHLFAGRAGRPHVIAHGSNFRPLKRVGDVVRVFAEVRRVVDAVLVLVGDGPDRPRVEALARELGVAVDVAFLGEQRDFVEVLQAADVFLLPSEVESFGLAALEALACGVPVVATSAGGVPEVVSDGEWGFLHAVGDLGAMAASVRRLCEDPLLWERMSRAARARVEAVWRPGPMVDRYEAFYRRIISPSTR
jgi:N-acetyl-alpha-D-glucosaminyl L-malate synthase BshA